MKATLEESYAKVERTKTGSQTLKDHTDTREEVNNIEEEALTKVETDTAMVKAEAPKLKDKSDDGKEDSGPMADEANESKAEMEAEKPDDPDAAADAAKQAEDTDKVANDSATMDDAFGQTATRAEQYVADAEAGEQKNTQSRATIDENKTIVENTRTEIMRIDDENTTAEAELDALNSYPEQVQKETAKRAQSAEELYAAAKGMNEELTSIQNDYYSEMAALPSKEIAQKKKDEEDAKKQKAPEPTPLSPEEEMLVDMGNMSEEQIEATLAGMDEKELASLDQALGGMETEKDDSKNQVVGKPDKHTGQVKVDLMKAFQSSGGSKTPPDPRQDDISKIEGKRTERISGVKQTADVNFVFLSEEQKQMLAQKLAMKNAVSGLFDIKILDMGKAMIMGMINPVESLKGVVDGASKMLTGAANLFNAEAWKADPLGNLLQSAADIATGLTMIFMSITGLATAITIIMTAITIASLGFAAPITGPVISFMAGVITTVGGWTVVTGLIALALNALTYIKNVHDAGVAQNTDQLLVESDAIKQNMTDGFTSAMAVVGGKGDAAGAKAMQKSIMKAGGGKAFAKAQGQGFKQGLQKAGQGAKNFVKGGVVSGTKKMAANGITKVKNGIGNALKKAKQGIKEAPTNIKNKFKNGVDNIKDKFRSKKAGAKGGQIDTPHGKLKTPKDGDSLGSFGGEKVKAELEFPDGHKAKSLQSGQCAICSNCQKIRSKYGPELDADPKMAKELKELETRLAAGDGTDAALLARQKQIHDKLLGRKSTRVKAEYDASAPSGKLSRDEIKTRLDQGKEFDPDTKRFKDSSEGKQIDHKAKVSEDQFDLGDASSTAGRGGKQEIKVSHSDIPAKKQRKLKTAEETRSRSKTRKDEVQTEFDTNGGVVNGKKYDRVEDVPEWKQANKRMIDASEELGELSTDAIVNSKLPGAKKLQGRPTSKSPNAKSGEFDAIYDHNGEMYIFESKGAGSQRGSRKTSTGKRAEQGSPEYRDDIINNLERQALETGDAGLLDTVNKLKTARGTGKLKFMQVTQKVDSAGKVVPEANVINFDQ